MSAPTSWRVWVEAARLRTLPAAIIPVLVGTALAASQGAANYTAAALCLSFALLVQIGTNYANDYYDFIHGADTAQRVGPRRAVAAGLVSPAAMRRAMALIMIVAFLVGLGLIRFGGWWLLPIGVGSILCGIAYTGGPYPLGYNGLGDIFVFLFFGLVAVTTTYYVQAGGVTWAAVICAALSKPSKARAWPMSMSPAISMVCTGSAKFNKRSKLLAALLERPTACAAVS